MDQEKRTVLRAAGLIREQIAALRQAQSTLFLPHRPWNRSQQYLNQIELARRKGWNRAAASLYDSLLREVNYCREQLDRLSGIIEQHTHSKPLPSQLEIYEEILGLRDEFDDFELDLKAGELRVVTEGVVLNGIDLGRFEIRLGFKHLDSSPCYRIVALDPNPAPSDDSVTHPHVQAEHLCEGEGRQAIESALADGRLSDFFLIVARLLGTYAVGNAYVELNHWEGIDCHDCGSATYQGERSYCSSCDEPLCDSCSISCNQCCESYCSGCIAECASCRQEHCQRCLTACSQCRQNVCVSCLSQGQCPSCQAGQAHSGDQDDHGDNTIDNQPAGLSSPADEMSPAKAY
jgi:hypothetical protein